MNPTSIQDIIIASLPPPPFRVKIIPPRLKQCTTFVHRAAVKAFKHHFGHLNQINKDGRLVSAKHPKGKKVVLSILPCAASFEAAIALPLSRRKLRKISHFGNPHCPHDCAFWGPTLGWPTGFHKSELFTDRFYFKDGHFYLRSLYNASRKQEQAA